jgi:hypothetical protein
MENQEHELKTLQETQNHRIEAWSKDMSKTKRFMQKMVAKKFGQPHWITR